MTVLDWTRGEPRLVLTTCGRCTHVWQLPHRHCPVCGSDDHDHEPARGTGLCVAVTRVHVTADGGDPVALALVELDEGPLVMGRLHDDGLAPGDRAAVDFRPDGPGAALVPSFAREA
ncbi:MAG: Zn-ribbon domain-containing OB-fold protein [Nocardioides sp.]